VSNAIPWLAADIPDSGHYCFVGLVGNEQDPPPDPTSFGDFDNYRSFIRNNNNVTWRNFNVVDDEPGEDGFMEMRFLAPGADDRTRRFCLEVIAKLPSGSRIQLEGPLPLFQAMQTLSGWYVVCGKETARIPINPHGPHRVGCAWFPPKYAFDMQLRVHIPEVFRVHPHHVAVRQLYEDEEVGRITWRLIKP
jgi:hypothetical protein